MFWKVLICNNYGEQFNDSETRFEDSDTLKYVRYSIDSVSVSFNAGHEAEDLKQRKYLPPIKYALKQKYRLGG